MSHGYRSRRNQPPAPPTEYDGNYYPQHPPADQPYPAQEGQYLAPDGQHPPADTSAYGARRFNRTLRSKRKEGVYRRSYWRLWIVMLSLAILIAIAIPTFVFAIEPVDGDSMQPTLRSGEQLLIGKLAFLFSPPRRFDVIICHYPGRQELYVKRVIALPGETIEITGGQILINGKALRETGFSALPGGGDMAALTVPPEHVFVIGDNRDASLDSRDAKVGPIPYRLITGRSSTVLLPSLRTFQ